MTLEHLRCEPSGRAIGKTQRHKLLLMWKTIEIIINLESRLDGTEDSDQDYLGKWSGWE